MPSKYFYDNELDIKELIDVDKQIPFQKIEQSSRDSIIIRTSVIGILTNVLLAVCKAFIGMASNSIAVLLDAVNNLSDALSSIITIVGTKLAGKLPDKEHPFGYGRIEYLSALTVAGLVLYAGITSAVESAKKIIYPEMPDYSTTALIFIAGAVLVKIVLGKYVKAQGEQVNSGSLIASGADAMFDAMLSLSVLISALIFITTGLSLEAYVGVAISLFIIKSGLEMIRDTVDEILGKRSDRKISQKVKALLAEEPEVLGAYDLVFFNYGPDKELASVHLELSDTMTVKEVDSLTRRLEAKIYREMGIILVGVGVYSHNTQDEQAMAIRQAVTKQVLAHPWALQIHGFYLDKEARAMRFDVVISFDIPHKEGISILQQEMQTAYPDYRILIVPDVDISE